MTIYDVDYFIQKFEAIPEEKWTAGMYYNSETEACCVLGHCGDRIEVNGGGSREWCALKVIFNNISANPVRVNDDVLEKVYPGKTPKQRILHQLQRIKNKQKLIVSQSLRSGNI